MLAVKEQVPEIIQNIYEKYKSSLPVGFRYLHGISLEKNTYHVLLADDVNGLSGLSSKPEDLKKLRVNGEDRMEFNLDDRDLEYKVEIFIKHFINTKK